MTHTEALTNIKATLPNLDDARVADLAELVQGAAEPATPFRDLTDEERAGLASAAEDYKTGRTFTPEQYRAEMDDFMACEKQLEPMRRRRKHSHHDARRLPRPTASLLGFDLP